MTHKLFICRRAAEQTQTSEVLLTRLKGDVHVSASLPPVIFFDLMALFCYDLLLCLCVCPMASGCGLPHTHIYIYAAQTEDAECFAGAQRVSRECKKTHGRGDQRCWCCHPFGRSTRSAADYSGAAGHSEATFRGEGEGEGACAAKLTGISRGRCQHHASKCCLLSHKCSSWVGWHTCIQKQGHKWHVLLSMT